MTGGRPGLREGREDTSNSSDITIYKRAVRIMDPGNTTRGQEPVSSNKVEKFIKDVHKENNLK